VNSSVKLHQLNTLGYLQPEVVLKAFSSHSLSGVLHAKSICLNFPGSMQRSGWSLPLPRAKGDKSGLYLPESETGQV
jgi:hypothetical protein